MLNSAVAKEEAALIRGVGLLRVPAPLEDQEARNATTGWLTLYSDLFKRWDAGITDFQVLQRKHGIRDKDQLAKMADPSIRRSFHDTDRIVGGDDPKFRDYIMEFVEFAGHLKRKRAPWLPLTEVDDPVHFDEAALRGLEWGGRLRGLRVWLA